MDNNKDGNKDEDKKDDNKQSPEKQQGRRGKDNGFLNRPPQPTNRSPQGNPGNQNNTDTLVIEQNIRPNPNPPNPQENNTNQRTRTNISSIPKMIPSVNLNTGNIRDSEGVEMDDEGAIQYLQQLVNSLSQDLGLTPKSDKKSPRFGVKPTDGINNQTGSGVKMGGNRKNQPKDELEFLDVEGVDYSQKNDGVIPQYVEDHELQPPATVENLQELGKSWQNLSSGKLGKIGPLVSGWSKLLPKDIKQLDGTELNKFVGNALGVLKAVSLADSILDGRKGVDEEEKKLVRKTKQMVRELILLNRDNDLDTLDERLQVLEPSNRIHLANDMLDQIRSNPKAKLTPVQTKCLETSLVDSGKEKFGQQLGKMIGSINDKQELENLIKKGFQLFANPDQIDDKNVLSNLDSVGDLISGIKQANRIPPVLKEILGKFRSHCAKKDPKEFDTILTSVKPSTRIAICDHALEEVKQNPPKKISISQAKCLAMGLMDVPQESRLSCLKNLRKHLGDKVVAKIAFKGMEVFGVSKVNGPKGADLAKGIMEFPELQFEIAKLVIKECTEDMKPGTGFNRATAYPKGRFLNSCGSQDPETRQQLMAPLKELFENAKDECEKIEEAFANNDPNAKQLAVGMVKKLIPPFLESLKKMQLPKRLLRMLGETYSLAKDKVDGDKKLPPPEDTDPNKKPKTWGDSDVEAQKMSSSLFTLGILSSLITDACQPGLVPELFPNESNEIKESSSPEKSSGNKKPSNSKDPSAKKEPSNTGQRQGLRAILTGLSQVIQGLGTQKDVSTDSTSVAKTYGELLTKEKVSAFSEMLTRFAEAGNELRPKFEIEEKVEEFTIEQTEDDEQSQPQVKGQNGDTKGIMNMDLAGTLAFFPDSVISAGDKKALLERNEDFYSALILVWEQVLSKQDHDENSKQEVDDEFFAFQRLRQLLEPLVNQTPQFDDEKN